MGAITDLAKNATPLPDRGLVGATKALGAFADAMMGIAAGEDPVAAVKGLGAKGLANVYQREVAPQIASVFDQHDKKVA